MSQARSVIETFERARDSELSALQRLHYVTPPDKLAIETQTKRWQAAVDAVKALEAYAAFYRN